MPTIINNSSIPLEIMVIFYTLDDFPVAQTALSKIFTHHFSGLNRAIGCLCVCVCPSMSLDNNF